MNLPAIAGVDLKLDKFLFILPHDESVIRIVYFLLHENGHLSLVRSYLLRAFHPGLYNISVIQVQPDIDEGALKIFWVIDPYILVKNLIMLNSRALLQNNSLLNIQYAKNFCDNILNFTSVISKQDQEAFLYFCTKVIDFGVVDLFVGATNKRIELFEQVSNFMVLFGFQNGKLYRDRHWNTYLRDDFEKMIRAYLLQDHGIHTATSQNGSLFTLISRLKQLVVLFYKMVQSQVFVVDLLNKVIKSDIILFDIVEYLSSRFWFVKASIGARLLRLRPSSRINISNPILIEHNLVLRFLVFENHFLV